MSSERRVGGFGRVIFSGSILLGSVTLEACTANIDPVLNFQGTLVQKQHTDGYSTITPVVENVPPAWNIYIESCQKNACNTYEEGVTRDQYSEFQIGEEVKVTQQQNGLVTNISIVN